MKIVCIFAEQLYAFHYDNEEENELYRLLALWSDVSYLYQFIKDNQADIPTFTTIEELLNQIIQNAHDIDDVLYDIVTNNYRKLEEFFEMRKIDKCRNFLKDNGIFDIDSFYEFLIE